MDENNLAVTNKQEPIDTEPQEEHAPVLRVWLFEGGRLQWHVAPMYQEEPWKGRAAARAIFFLLLCAPNRQALRGHLTGILWPEMEEENARSCLRSALKVLRQVLRLPQGQDPLIEAVQNGEVLQLKGQEIIWVDADAFEALVQQASQESDPQRTLPFWQQARALLKGEVLAEDRLREWITHRWIKARRQRVQVARRRLVRSLADLYVQRGEHVQAEELLQEHVINFPTDQDALYRLMKLLIKAECFVEAREAYERCKAALTGLGKHPAEPLKVLAERLVTLPQALESTPLLKQDLVESYMKYSRRQMMRTVLSGACTILTISSYGFLQPEEIERLLTSVYNPSHINEVVLDDFAEITRRYWRLSTNASFQLLNGLFGLFQDLIQLLSVSQTKALSEGLYSLSSEVAQLLGKTLFDLRDYPLAMSYYGFALKASLEAHNYDLWGTALGRMGLLFLSSNQPQQALALLGEAQSAPIHSKKICAWHAVIEAEAYSYLNNPFSCRKALERAKDTSEATFLEPDIYATGFTRARLVSYEGSCYLRLNQPENALPVLEQARKLIDPTAVRRLSRLLTYLGKAHMMLGNPQQASDYAHQALDLTQQTQSLDILRHIEALRDNLLIRGEMLYTKDLDKRIKETHNTIKNAGVIYG